DFDVLVGGHVSRLGTKEDVQIKVDFFADIQAGAEFAISTVSASDVAAGTGVFDPTNANAGNTWCAGVQRTYRSLVAAVVVGTSNLVAPPAVHRRCRAVTGVSIARDLAQLEYRLSYRYIMPVHRVTTMKGIICNWCCFNTGDVI
ncbi:unnamed protein product, partial [Laminaria digitata]